MSENLGKHKHRVIFEELRESILSGQYRAGDRLPSENALIRSFEVSRPTAARALRDLENSGLVERRRGSGTYVLHSSHTRAGTLGLLIPGLGQGEIFEPICNEIARSAQSHNFTIFWGSSPTKGDRSDSQMIEELCQQYVNQKVAGVFFEPIELAVGMEETNQRITETLEKAGIPVVLIDCDVAKFPERSKFDLVGIDNRRVGYCLASHLLAMGCRRIDYVARSKSAATVDARIAGYQEASLAQGIIPKPEWIHRNEEISIDFVRQMISDDLPDAFICGNDYTAAQLMRDLMKLGFRIPEDVRIVGVDDLKYASALSIPLTTIRQPCKAIGAAAVEAMVQRISYPTMPARDILLDFELIIRESCGHQLTGSTSQ